MVSRNISLKEFNSFGLNYRADYLITVKSESEILEFLDSGVSAGKPVLILGSGSNLLFTGDFHGVILHPEIGGINIEDESCDNVVVSAGAGVNWDEFVEWAVSNNLGGIENLSFIPGSVGATPVQNIGAYGEEIKDYITYVRAISLEDGSVRIFGNSACCFGYRDSIFKQEFKNRYLVTRVFYRLFKNSVYNLSYGLLQEETEKSGEITLKSIREAVIRIRKSRLPEPMEHGNAGSFFKNPVTDAAVAETMKIKYPAMPVFQFDNGKIKIPAGWLIEQCGWKGKRFGDAGVWEKQALVLVNYGNATGVEILELSQMIQKSVYEKFGIVLEREVEVIE